MHLRKNIARWTVSFSLLLAACRGEQTAVVLEATSAMPAGALDDVVFQVSGDALDGGAREAVAALSGPGAKTFPLQLVLVSDDARTDVLQVTVQGRKAGTVKARGIPEDGATPIAFVPGRVTVYRFVLRSVDDPATTPIAVPDAGTREERDGPQTPIDADAVALRPPDAGIPINQGGGPGQDCGGSFICRTGLLCVAGRCCVSTCQDECLSGLCGTGGTCAPKPDGTPCHGASDMACKSGRCVKSR